MAAKIKLYVGRKMLDSLQKTTQITPTDLKPLLRIGYTTTDNCIELNIPLSDLEDRIGISNINRVLSIQPDDIIENIKSVKDRANRKICLKINRNIFIKDVIENCTYPDLNMLPKTVVIDFSSPNIAKPFHVGHVRSTIIGNFISNLQEHMRNKVMRINYLGDWGTQFGYIKVGVNKLNYSEEEIKKNPIKLLYESYVYAHSLAESKPDIHSLAKDEFLKLEKGSAKDLEEWKTYTNYSMENLKTMYDRLGVQFDEYHFESMYSTHHIQNVLDKLQRLKLLEKQSDGKMSVVINDRSVTLLKSDGTSLYLTRDVAAAIDRYEKYKFDQMLYVVENGQSEHFNALRQVLVRMDLPWSNRLRHIKFGRIRGMSSRKGNVVFLKDLLDETKELMYQRQVESPTTKAPINDEKITDNLGVSCVIIHDLKQRRQKDYEFSWDRVLQVKGDSAIKLHYTHCRLCSLERNSGAVPAQQCDPSVLDQSEITELVRELARFHDIVYDANEQLESCFLVSYLFNLCNHISKALKVVRVKGEAPDIASQRLLVFMKAKEVLHQGMVILGLRPLSEM